MQEYNLPPEVMEEYGITPYEEDIVQPDSSMNSLGISPEDMEAFGITLAEEAPPSQGNTLENVLAMLAPYAQANNDFFAGIRDAFVNLPKGLANMVTPESMQVPLSQSSEGLPYDIGNVVGDIGSFIGGGGALNSARLAAQGLPGIGKIASALGGEGIRGIGRRALGSGLYGAAQSPEDREIGAGLGAGTSVAVDSLLKGLGKLIPKKIFSGNLSDEELIRNLEVARGTQTGLGDIIGSPLLKRISENSLSKNPISRSDSITARIANDIQNKSNSLVENYLGNTNPLEVPEKLGEALTNAYQKEVSFKNSLYDHANKLATESNLKLDLPNFSSKAREYSDLINDQNFLKYEPKAKQILNRLINYKNPVQETHQTAYIAGQPFKLPGKSEIKYPTLKESNILASKLNELSNLSKRSISPEDRYQSKIFGELSKILKSDIKESIEKSGNSELKNAFKEAEMNYKENFSQFLDKDIYKYLGGERSPENLITDFIKTGSTTDKGNQIKKLMGKLSEEDQNLVKYAYLSRAIQGAEDQRNVNPMKLSTLWNDTKLGPRQRKSLIPEESERRRLDNLSKLTKMNINSLNRMFNPHTGQRNAELLWPVISGYTMGQKYFGNPIIGGLAGILGAGLASRGASKFLHSPDMREIVVNKILKDRAKTESSSMLGDSIKAALIDLMK